MIAGVLLDEHQMAELLKAVGAAPVYSYEPPKEGVTAPGHRAVERKEEENDALPARLPARWRRDQTEYRYNNVTEEPRINGKLIVDGETYLIRDVEWLLRRDHAGDKMTRFLCTLAVEPAFVAHSDGNESGTTAPASRR